MESMPSRSFLMKIQTSDDSILVAWKLLGDMLMQGETGYVSEWLRYYEHQLSMRSIITITLHGVNDILIKISGSCEKEQLLPFLAKEVLLAVLWETYQSYWRAWNHQNLSTASIRRCMAQDVILEECRPKENETNPELGLESQWLTDLSMMHGLLAQELNSEEVTLTNHHMPI